MKKIFILTLFAALCTILPAQQQTSGLTMEDLIPGGRTFYNYYPRIAEQYQWSGSNLMCVKNDSVFVIANPVRPAQRELAFTFAGLKDKAGLSDGRVTRVSFAREGGQLQFYTYGGTGVYNMEAGAVDAYFAYAEGSENHHISPQHQWLAYTTDNNLFLQDASGNRIAISDETNKGIVYGQSVHRNEFGINGGTFWSPDGKKLAFYRMDETMVTDYPLVNVSTRIATLNNIKYPMAGMTSHEVTLGVYDTESRQTVYMKTGEPRDKYLTNVAWSPDNKSIYIAEINREQNHAKLVRYNAASGEQETVLFEETHPKYVEPGNPIVFVPGNDNRFIWQSKRDGFNHIYLYDTSGNMLKQLTQGDWDVVDVMGFDSAGRDIYFTAAHPLPIDRHVFGVNLRNGKIKQHTLAGGTHAAQVSASGRFFIDMFSANDNPGEVALVDLRNGNRQILASAANPYKDLNVPAVELGTIKAADGVTDLYYRMLKPAGFDASKSYPVVMYVYGGPHSQMVVNRWRYGSGGWELHMAEKGYVVFVMDNRGTSNRGFEFENVIHRQLGVEEAKDQICGVEFLKSMPFVDASRIGVHGWSYGGFMTTTLLLDYPDVFKVGVAGGPVIDWKYYEVMYGERYMDTPQENPEGYEKASLLNKAGKLKSRLLLIHGDEDPTVVWQNSIMFLKSCIGAGTHPDYFIYPGHGHNMSGHDRVHLYEHITRYFDDHINK